MSRRSDRELEARLRELRAPDEAEAEERSLSVLRSAYEDHEPLRPSRATRRIGLGVACGVVALGIGLSPAGAKVGDFVSDVFEPEPAGEPDAKPQLRSLPAAGQLLVQSADGPWVVQADGSKRLLGDYSDAEWSPRGLFVAVADGHDLAAVDPAGNVRWTYPAGARVARPVWSPCCDGPAPDQRIAFFSGDDLRAIDADGSDDRLVARGVGVQTVVWSDRAHVVTYRTSGGSFVSEDVDSGERVRTRAADLGDGRAVIRSSRNRSRLVLVTGGGRTRTLFEAPGRLTGPTWSPDGKWILVGWPDADQWLFIPVDRSREGVYFDRIAEQFDPRSRRADAFPRVLGWAPAPAG